MTENHSFSIGDLRCFGERCNMVEQNLKSPCYAILKIINFALEASYKNLTCIQGKKKTNKKKNFNFLKIYVASSSLFSVSETVR